MATTAKRDYYGILGVAPTASEDEIRHAYRRLAKLWHPDRYRVAPERLREQAERRMRLLTEAHGVLGNAEKRAEYDREYLAAPGHHHSHASHAGVGPVVDRPFYGNAASYVPGSQPPRDLPIVARNENGFALFIGLILSLATLAAFSPARGRHRRMGHILKLISRRLRRWCSSRYPNCRRNSRHRWRMLW